MRKLVVMILAVVSCATALAPGTAHAAPPPPKQYDTWAFCGVRPDDPTAQAAAISMATAAGIDATFGPCNVPTPDYTPANPANRYVDPATYLRLVQINARAGMKTVVYDARVWSDDAATRETAIAFWQPVYRNIAAWDLGDEFQSQFPEWQILIHRWNVVRNFVSRRTGIEPFANQNADDAENALADLPGSENLVSFDRYTGDLGASVARQLDARVKKVMCAVNAYTHLIFTPSADSIRSDMAQLADAGCDIFLIFGGQRVYDTNAYGGPSLVDLQGAPTDWAPGVLEGSGVSSYTPTGPARLLETRGGLVTVDGQANGIGPRAADSVTELQVAARAGVSANATSVVLNVTVTNPTAAGFITVFACGSPRPTAAQLNYSGGDVSTAVIAKIGAGGKVCLYTLATTDLVVDLNGFYPSGTSFTSLQPARLLETRSDPGLTTVDGAYSGVGVRGGGSTTVLQVAGRGGVPAGATDAVLSVTATNVTGAGYVTVFPCADGLPTASSLNYTAGSTITNAVITQLGADGQVCLFTQATVDLVVDVSAYYPPRSSFVSMRPSRMMDTRTQDGSPTIDGLQYRTGLRAAGSVTELAMTGRAGIPVTAKSVVLNLTVTKPARAGFVTVFACGGPRPNASNINFSADSTVANLVVAKIGVTGSVCLYTSVDTHLVVDVTNYHP